MAAACDEAKGPGMSHEDHLYHARRERHCRSMAKLAADPEVRRRHEELAELHAGRASKASGSDRPGTQPAT
jgi:hypothetical protein